MKPYLDDGDVRLYHGDVREVLAGLADASVDCIVTSPPYWQLRDYGSPDQIGLEPTIEEYVAALVGVFRQVRRVLAPWGTCWLNLGDSYFGPAGGYNPAYEHEDESAGRGSFGATKNAPVRAGQRQKRAAPARHATLKTKDLCMVPARVALALQADGWWLRSRVIWAKPNPMPESVTDRPTSSYEEIFLLTKAPTYYYDAEAVREPVSPATLADRRYEHRHELNAAKRKRDVGGRSDGFTRPYAVAGDPSGRNLRNVWTIATEPTPEAHFATFPLELVRRCLAAGCPERVCRECGEPSRRVVETTPMVVREGPGRAGLMGASTTGTSRTAITGTMLAPATATTTGWTDCGHDAYRPGIVLDPFIGSGKTAQQARRMGLHAIGIDGSEEYLGIAARRLQQLSLLGQGGA